MLSSNLGQKSSPMINVSLLNRDHAFIHTYFIATRFTASRGAKRTKVYAEILAADINTELHGCEKSRSQHTSASFSSFTSLLVGRWDSERRVYIVGLRGRRLREAGGVSMY